MSPPPSRHTRRPVRDAPEARPYPFERWPRAPRSEVALRRRCARALPLRRLDEATGALASLLGAPVVAGPRRLDVCPPGALADSLAEPLVAAILVGAAPRLPALALELSPDLALAAIDGILGGDGAPIGDPNARLSDVERGVLAFGVAHVLQRAASPLRVAAVVTTTAGLAAALGDEGSAAWSVELTLGAVHGVARLWVPEDATLPEPTPPDAAPWGPLPLTLALDAGEATLDAEDLRSLAPGDIVVLDAGWTTPGDTGRDGSGDAATANDAAADATAAEDAAAKGAAAEDAASGDATRRARARLVGARRTTWWCARDAAGWRVERIERSWAEAAPARGDEAMSDEDTEGTDPGRDAPATLTDLGDAPVEVAVELGRLRLSLAQLTALRPGELLSTGVPIGERVRLRAGDTILGEGELVDVEGEVGVRILHLAGS